MSGIGRGKLTDISVAHAVGSLNEYCDNETLSLSVKFALAHLPKTIYKMQRS